MRLRYVSSLVTTAPGAVLFALGLSCSGTKNSDFSDGGLGGAVMVGESGGGGGAGGSGGAVCLSSDCDGGGGAGGSNIEGGADGAACPGCKPDPCLAQGKTATSISGYVYDPAGNLPLYGVYVYIPSSAPLAIDPGNPACTPCEAAASGGPIIGTLTDEHGYFNLQQGTSDPYGVPSGTNIPLVIQTGKWRKQAKVPVVTACGPTAIPNPTTPAMKLRLPANSSEGDMPLIAFTSGCDPAECFLRHVGISDSEFVAPNSPMPAPFPTVTPGAGHVHFFTGNNNAPPDGGAAPVPASAVAGGNTPADTYTWWGTASNLEMYDIVFNACECSPFPRGANAYAAVDSYLNAGGRLFTTHYYYNWFAPSPPATADLFGAAAWNIGGTGGTITGTEADSIDQTFPKGVAFATWLQDNAITTTLGSITLGDTRDDVSGLLPAGCEATQSCISTRWIYDPADDDHPRYISFNTPIAATVAKQCGRAVFSDVHLSGTSYDEQFPAECMDPNIDPTGDHATNEKALEFLFFDLSSCVQNNSQPPIPPPPQ
jgi:hypothetical protein